MLDTNPYLPGIGRPLGSRYRGMADLLPEWRRQRVCEEIPEWRALPPALRVSPLTQGTMATLLGVTERHFRNFEKRGGSGFSRPMVEAAVRILGLNTAQADAVWRWTEHDEMPVGAPQDHVSDELRRLLNVVPHGAYFSNSVWDIVAYNSLAALHWPWITAPGANIMGWALGWRTGSRAVLSQYTAKWVRPMVAQLRASYLADPLNPRLLELIATVRQNPAVRQVWDTGSDVRPHAQGEIRPVRMPLLAVGRPVDIQLLALQPLGEDLRLVIAMPTDPHLREPILPAV